MLKISSRTTVDVILEEVTSPALLLDEKTYIHFLGSDLKEIKGILQEMKKQANRYSAQALAESESDPASLSPCCGSSFCFDMQMLKDPELKSKASVILALENCGHRHTV